MGLFDSIRDAASSVKATVSSGVENAKDAAVNLARRVDDAPAAISHAARDGLRGVAELGRDLAKDPGGTLKKVGRQALEGARNVGTWSWKHKGEIGFWVGTTALLLAVPVSGGASGALAGSMLAARGAAIAGRIGSSGRIGAAAVNSAKAGVQAVSSARGAFGGTRSGAAMSRTGHAVGAGRVALGGTHVGRAMIAAQKPVTAASTVLAGINLADTTRRYVQGDASKKDVALATLGFAPTGVAVVRTAAAKRSTAASVEAADVAKDSLDTVASQAAGATDEVARVAAAAPRINAPITANVASEARQQAAHTADKAFELRDRVAMTASAPKSDGAISATTLARELDDVAARASTARATAADAKELAPDALTSSARVARDRLDDAQAVATRARHDILGLARVQRRADRLAHRAEKLEGAIGTTALHAGNINNGIKVADDPGGWSLTDGSLARGLAGWLLGRNAKATVPNLIPRPDTRSAHARAA